MRKKIFVLTTISLFTLLSCNYENKKNRRFENEVELVAEEIFANEYFAKKIVVADDYIVVQTNQKDSLFKLYSADKLEYLSSFGRKGDGPNDFLYPYTTSQTEKKGNEISIWYTDIFKYTFSKINLTKSINDGQIFIEKKLNFHPRYDFTHHIVHLNDSIFYANLGPNALKRHRLVKFNSMTEKTERAELIPKVENIHLLNRAQSYSLFFDELGIKPDKSRLVSAMSAYNRIDFYDLDMNLLFSFAEPEEDHVQDANDIINVKSKSMNALRNYYSQIQCTDKYVYALFKKGNYSKDIDTTMVNIRVFNWKGDFKFNLKVPNYLNSFSVDEKNGWIYGINRDGEKNYRYKLEL